jgi:two-component system OmpR family response regulator
MPLLLIEDDAELAAEVKAALSAHDLEVTHCAEGAAGLAAARTGGWSAVIADRMLPQIDGLDIVRAMRAAGDRTPILVLSALDSVDERVRGLRAGGDDYLGKPFAVEELVARVESLLRRAANASATSLRVDDLELDLLQRRAIRGGRTLDLTAREFRLLEYFARHAGKVVTRAMLLKGVWDIHYDPQTNVVDVHVSRLRQAVDKEFERPLIHTVRGVGYSMYA